MSLENLEKVCDLRRKIEDELPKIASELAILTGYENPYPATHRMNLAPTEKTLTNYR